jgi:hypothetical protein
MWMPFISSKLSIGLASVTHGSATFGSRPRVEISGPSVSGEVMDVSDRMRRSGMAVC